MTPFKQYLLEEQLEDGEWISSSLHARKDAAVERLLSIRKVQKRKYRVVEIETSVTRVLED